MTYFRLPNTILAVGAAGLGLVLGHLTGIFDGFLGKTIAGVDEHHAADWFVIGLSTVAAVAGIGLAWAMIWAFVAFVHGEDGLPLFAITFPPSLALIVSAITMVCGVLAAVAPARRAAKLDPAQAIRI